MATGARRGIPTAMTTDLLTLTQWLSPSYPVGAFAYSHGLEAAIGMGWINGRDSLHDWLHDVLTDGSGRNDCILLRVAHAGEVPLDDVNATGIAFAASAERQKEAKLQGAAFVATTAAIWETENTDLIYPVAIGAAVRQLDLDLNVVCAMYLQAMMSNLIAAAQRLMPLGQTDGQAILNELNVTCQTVGQETDGATLDDLHACAFLSDIAAMQHETQSPRIFRT